MPKKSKKNLTIYIILSVVAAIVIIKALTGHMPFNLGFQTPARGKGSRAAKVQITEFIDFQCPACANGSKFLKEYLVKHPSDIYLEVKYFPLPSIHRHAQRSARYAECSAQQNKFWPMLDLLMEEQPRWAGLMNAEDTFKKMASVVQLDKGQLDACLRDQGTERIIIKEKELGQSMGVQSTPTYFINGKLFVGVKSLKDELNTYFGDVTD